MAIIRRFVSLFKNRAFKVTACIALFLTSVLIILAMLLGNEAGTFVIRVHDGDAQQSIAITDNPDYANEANHYKTLSAPGFDNIDCWTPKNGFFANTDGQNSGFLYELTSIPGKFNPDDPDFKALVDEYDEAGIIRKGDMDFTQVYCYTFYIVNTTPANMAGFNVKVEMDYDASKTTKYLDEAARIMTYAVGDGVADPIHIYQKEDNVDNKDEDKKEAYIAKKLEYDTYLEYPIAPTYFNTKDTLVFGDGEDTDTSEIIFMQPNRGTETQYIKYSVLFWLEGWDPDTEYYTMFSGTFQFSLDVSIADAEQ